MKKTLQTQWDFAQPAPEATPQRKVFTVAELTSKVRTLLETNIGHAWVSGEISNFRLQTSGHAYFTLKDLYAQISCVLFKADARGVNRSLLKDGETITLHGEMTVYEPRGQYQLRVLAIELQGVGKLQAAFEKLKLKLNAEGLFAPQRKRPIPLCPARIGLVTSLDGAALRDVLHVIQRRQPSLQIFIAPCRVQGSEASREIARSLKLLNDWSETHPLDLILLTRGGGSLEDLWAFNEEQTARAIAASKLPVISAIGHEIDFTISDFVADLRAATPSAAAEQITEGACSIRQQLLETETRLHRLLRQRFNSSREELERARRELERRQPARVLRERQQRLDDLRSSMERCVAAGLRNAREQFRNAGVRQLRLLAHARLKEAREQLRALDSQLRLLGPQQTLNRGYSITTDASDGAIIRDSSKVETGRKLRTRLAKGEINSVVFKE